MTKKELGIIISRVFALFMFFGCINLIVSIPALFVGERYLIAMYGSSILIHIFLAGFFWFKAETIGEKIVFNNADKNISLAAYDQCMHIVFIGFGLWMISNIIPDASSIIAYLISDGLIEGRKIRGFDFWEPGLRIAFYLILGALLILRSEGLRRALLGLRNAGLYDKND